MYSASSATNPDIVDGAFVSVDGARLPLYVWGPDDARMVVVGLHGLNDYGAAFRRPAATWAEHGVRTYAYDQRGFGGAPGRAGESQQVLAQDAVAFLEVVRKRHPGAAIFMVGESLGAAVAVSAAADAGRGSLDGLILAAPAIRPKASLPVYQRVLGWLAMQLVPGATVARDPLQSKATDNVDVLRAMAEDPKIAKEVRFDTFLSAGQTMDAAARAALHLDVPVLVLVGERDPVLPPSLARDLLVRLEGAAVPTTLKSYDEGYHLLFRDLAGGSPTSDAMAWMTSRARSEVAELSAEE